MCLLAASTPCDDSPTVDAHDLHGAFVVEAGVRQAWPFLTFALPNDDNERRLYIDTTFRLDDKDLTDGDPERAAAELLILNNRTVTEVTVADDRSLTVRFDPGQSLIVAGAAAAFTTHDAWWFGKPG